MVDRAKLLLFISFFGASVVCCTPNDFENVSPAALSAQQVAVDWMKEQYPERKSFEIEEIYSDIENELSPNISYEFEGGGFVVVSVSDKGMAVLAYSNDTTLSGEEGDDVLVYDFIGNLKVVSNLQDSSSKLIPRATPPTVVQPLIKTTWGQSGGYYPNFTYNKMTPLVASKQRAPVGCVAVAFGQVLNYYQFPQKGIGYKTYCSTGKAASSCSGGEIIEADFRTGYDWMNMPEKLAYNSGTSQVDAVSKLLFHLGISVNASYAAHGTSAQISNPTVFNGFRKHFKMTEVTKVSRSDYTDIKWEELIKNELVNGRPVVFFGEDVSIGAGHAYIIDGIDKTGFVHVNFGWNGSANGYYNLGSLVVDNKYNFTGDLNAYIKFAPPIKTVQKDYVMTLRPGEWRDIEVDVGSNDFDFETVEDIKVDMNFSGQWRGDADLYVKRGSRIENSNDFDCAPKKGSSIETCSLKGKGKYFVTVNGYNENGQKSDSPITLKITYKVYVE